MPFVWKDLIIIIILYWLSSLKRGPHNFKNIKDYAIKGNSFPSVWLPFVMNGCSMNRLSRKKSRGKILLLKVYFLVFYLNLHFNRYFWLHNCYFLKSLFHPYIPCIPEQLLELLWWENWSDRNTLTSVSQTMWKTIIFKSMLTKSHVSVIPKVES